MTVVEDRVAEHLLAHGWVSRAQVDEARRTQGFFGGRLTSYLLKLGYVSEAVLGEALTEVAGVPFASWEHLRVLPPEVVASVPEKLVERFRVCPIRLEEGCVRIATLNPRDAVAIREIQAATGMTVEPWITTEPRLYQAIERWYKVRFEAAKGISLTGVQRPPSSARFDREGADEAALLATEPEVGLDGRPMDAQVTFEEYERGTRSDAAEAEPAAAVAAPDADPDTEAPSWETLDNALAGARDRNDVAEALFTFCAPNASRIGLFAVGRDAVRGVAGRGRAFDALAMHEISAPVGSGTIFDSAQTSRDFYFGSVPGLPANRDLYTALGGKLPSSVMLLPIIVKDRVVAWLYLDGDEGPLPRPDIPRMRRVAAKTSLAFEMLLLKNKLRGI